MSRPGKRATSPRVLVRRLLAVAATILLGGALAWAPVAAFTGQMLWVTKAALAGLALLLVVKLLPRDEANSGDPPPGAHHDD